MNTEQLVELAACQLNTGEFEDDLVKARQANLPLLVTFKVSSNSEGTSA